MGNKETSRISVLPQCQSDKIRGLMGLHAKAVSPSKYLSELKLFKMEDKKLRQNF